jgi:chemotaxis protein MotB
MSKNLSLKDRKHAAPIVKKKLHPEEDGHHGGVWKIAYADFMTAMMTFFLVMWLINSASKEKIIQLANYFNPVKLSDRIPTTKGVHENQKGGPEADKTPEEVRERAEVKAKAKEKEKESAKQAAKSNNSSDNSARRADEEHLFRNPFGVLTELASQADGTMAAMAAQSKQEMMNAGGSSHDPFVTDPIMNQIVSRTAGAGERQGPARDIGGTTPSVHRMEASSHPEGKAADAKRETGLAEKQSKEKKAKAGEQEKAAQLEKDLAKLVGSLPQSFRPNIATKATSEGILLSLTDDANFNMFRISSAEPSPQLVVFLEKAGALINKYPGRIVVRGHTDGRPFAGDKYGNWRLSVDRATMTYYMLLRGKVDDRRFLALEGYADRSLKNKGDPFAGENRRIEILIKAPEA